LAKDCCATALLTHNSGMGAAVADERSQPLAWKAGDLRVDVGTQSVQRAGVPVEVPRLSFELLVALLRAAPNFVSNDELVASVWKGLVVSPETVTQRVKLLRDALGDDPRDARYIEGLRGRGYRMIPAVTPLPAEAQRREEPVPAKDTHFANPGSPPFKSQWTWLLAALFALLVAGLALMSHRQASAPEPNSTVAADRAVAVLPFSNTLSSPVRDEMAQGIADSVNAQLATISGLTVISPNSSSQVDSAKLGARETGRILGAHYLVQGSIQQSGDRVRISARLIDSDSSALLWTEQFEDARDNMFGMQDRVAAGVAQALQSRIAGLDATIPAAERSANLDAYLAYLRGRTLLGRTTIVGSTAAEREFKRSIELDPAYAPAIVGLYDARMQAASLRRTGLDKALKENAPLLEQASRLRPDSGAIDLARAMWSDESVVARSALFERGLKRDRANARAMTAYSEMLDNDGDRAEGEMWLQRALRIDPLWPRARFRLAQRTFAVVGSAVELQNLKTLELDPNYYPALQRRAKYQWAVHGETAQSIMVIERAIASDPENPWGIHTAIAFYLDVDEPRMAAALARGNEVAEASTRALRAQYDGDWRAAGEAALADGSYVFGKPERWGVTAALRDYALRTGDFDRIIPLLSKRYNLPLDAQWKLGTDNFREGQYLAHLLLAQGHRAEGLRRLDAVIAWIDANEFMGPVYNLRTKAQALALKGEIDAALALLAESFQQKDYTHAWYTARVDPTWESVRHNARFVAIVDDIKAHAENQKRLLGTLRGQGATAAAPGASIP
jgi:TolB-like protein/DNA-binding winged helix-turn-helix (wHTH) protein